MSGLALMIGGRRYADDSPRGRTIPQDTTCTTSAAGGFDELTCSLLRNPLDVDTEAPDETVQLVSDGGATEIWSGRLMQEPLSAQQQWRIQPQALGLHSLLADRSTLQWLGIARDTSSMGASPDDRADLLNTVPVRPGADAGATDGGLRLALSGETWSSLAGRPHAEAARTLAPLTVGRVLATFRKRGDAAGSTAYESRITSFDAAWNPIESSPNYGGTAGDTQTVDWSPSTPAERVSVWAYPPASSGGSENSRIELLYQALALVGDHGLSLHGTGPGDYGLYWPEVLRHLIERFAPAAIRPGAIATSTLRIPHLAWLSPTSLAQMLTDGSTMTDWTWGVWDAGRLNAGPWSTASGRVWRVRADDPGVDLQLDGYNVANLYTDIVVYYRLPDGRQASIGSPHEIAEQHDDRLAIADPTHPLLRRGRRRSYALQLDIPADAALAVMFGRVKLQQLNAARRSGRITVTGSIRDEHGTRHPAWRMRSGDHIVVTDLPDLTPRRVMRTSLSLRTLALTAEIDRNLQTTEALLASFSARGTGALG